MNDILNQLKWVEMDERGYKSPTPLPRLPEMKWRKPTLEELRTTAAQMVVAVVAAVNYVPGPTWEQMFELAKLVDELRPRHYRVDEDNWYSCPKAPDGCADDSKGTNCTCGADERNKEIDAKLIALGLIWVVPEKT